MSAAAMVSGVQRLHARLRSSVDLMGIGLAAPRGDTVAEDNAAGAAAGKDVGDVRWAGGRGRLGLAHELGTCTYDGRLGCER